MSRFDLNKNRMRDQSGNVLPVRKNWQFAGFTAADDADSDTTILTPPVGEGVSLTTAVIAVSADGTLGVGPLASADLLNAASVTLTSGANRNIHGMATDLTAGGMMPYKSITNGNAPGGADFIFSHNSASVSGGTQNRFSLPTPEGSSYTLKPGETLACPYAFASPSTNGRWAKEADADALTTGELWSALITRRGRRDGEERRISGVGAVGVGAGPARWAVGASPGAVTGLIGPTLSGGYWQRVLPDGTLTPQMFGWSSALSTANQTVAWDLWLAAVCASAEKSGFVPAATYTLGRYAGVDNITADGFTVTAARGAVIRYDQSLEVLGGTGGTETRNAFQATSRTNLRFVGIGFGAITAIHLNGCEDVLIDGLRGDGNVTSGDAINHHWYTGVHLYACKRVTLTNSHFKNFEWGFFLNGSNASRCKTITVSDCHFYNTKLTTMLNPAISGIPVTGQTTDFPAGIYVYYADHVVVRSSHFTNICAAVSLGSRGTGMGGGIYEGDGACGSLTIGGCTFTVDRGDGYGFSGIYINTTKQLDIQPCIYNFNSTNPISVPIGGDAVAADATSPGAQSWKINAGPITMVGGTNRYAIQAGTTDNSSYPLTVKVSGAIINGGRFQWSKNHTRNVALAIVDNETYGSPDAGIEVLSNVINVNPIVARNRVERAACSGIVVAGSVRSQVHNNQIFDCNTLNETSDDGKYSGIVFPSYGYGASLKGNHVENRGGLANTVGGANMRLAVHAAASVSPLAWKYDNSNTSFGLPPNIPTLYQYFYTAAPASGFDWKRGDVAFNALCPAGGVERWVVSQCIETTLTTNLVATNTTVQLASTSGMGIGDLFAVVVNPSTIDANIGDATQYYFGAVLTVDSGVQVTLVGAIPSSRTFPTSTSRVYVIRFKAAAAIAA